MPAQAQTILALDTALGACSVAIWQDGRILASAHERRQTGHAEALMPMISKVCDEAGLALADIDLFAVTQGPGTFTGLRIGLAAARGLAQALDRPLIGFSTLETIGWGSLAALPASPKMAHLVVVHDARRGEVYAQSFAIEQDSVGPALAAMSPPTLLEQDRVEAFLPTKPTWLVGSGAALVAATLAGGRAAVVPDAPANPDAAVLAALAARRFDAGSTPHPRHYLDTPPLTPIYLRAPDAKLPGGATV